MVAGGILAMAVLHTVLFQFVPALYAAATCVTLVCCVTQRYRTTVETVVTLTVTGLVTMAFLQMTGNDQGPAPDVNNQQMQYMPQLWSLIARVAPWMFAFYLAQCGYVCSLITNAKNAATPPQPEKEETSQ